MARHKRRKPYEDVPPRLEISSLIDICFLLLIYFLVTSVLIPRETDLDMRLPAQVQTDTPPDIDPMFIRVDANGVIYLGTGTAQEALDVDADDRNVPLLAARLDIYSSTARAAGATPLVQIYADPNSSQQRVIDVLNALAGARITSVTFTDLIDP